MKIKLTATIDEDLMNILKTKYNNNMSEKVNELIADGLSKEEDKFSIFHKFLNKKAKFEKEAKEWVSVWEKQLDEGNKQEREEASAHLKLLKENLDDLKKKYLTQYIELRKTDIWEQFLKEGKKIDLNEPGIGKFFLSWALKFRELDYSIGSISLRDIYVNLEHFEDGL